MAVFPNLNLKIRDAVTKLEEQLVRRQVYLSVGERLTNDFTGAIQGPGITRGSHQSQRGHRCWSGRCEGGVVVV